MKFSQKFSQCDNIYFDERDKPYKNNLTGQGLLKVFEEDLVDGPLGKGVLIIPECVDWVAPDAFEDLDNLETIIFPYLFLKTEEFAKKYDCLFEKGRNIPLYSDEWRAWSEAMSAIGIREIKLSRESLKIDWSRCPNLKNILHVPPRKHFHSDSREAERYLREKSKDLKERLSLPDHISFKSVYKDVLINPIVQPIWDETKSRVFDRLRMILPSHHNRGQTLFLPPELFRTLDQFADLDQSPDKDLLKDIDETLERWFEVNVTFNLKGNYSYLKQYKKTINKVAFLFCLKHIYEGVKRLTESDTLSDTIKLDARKKCYVILKLKKKIEQGTSLKKLFSPLEARFLLHEGKGRIKHLLEEFMPKLKTKLELLANSEVLEEASSAIAPAAAASSHALMKA